jgi:hypothetical protein
LTASGRLAANKTRTGKSIDVRGYVLNFAEFPTHSFRASRPAIELSNYERAKAPIRGIVFLSKSGAASPWA